MKCETYCLGDVCTFIDYRGKTPPKTTSGIPLVTAKIVKNGMIQEPQEFIAEDYYDEWMRRGIPKKGSVVFTTEAPLGEVARIRTDDKLAFAQRIIVLEPKTKQLSADYLFYALQDHVLKSRIEARSTGTTVIGIKAAELKKVEIDLPSLEEQTKIAAILCSLDDKIELNNKINENLEQQAQTIYHKWFETISKDRLPIGWQVVALGDVAIISKKSFNPSKEHETMLEHYSIPAYDEARFPVFELSTAIKSNKFVIDDCCFMASKLNPTTKRVWKPYCLTKNAVCSTEFIVYKAKNSTITDFLYAVIDSASFSDFMCSHVTGSTGSRQRTTPSDTLSFEFVLPSEDELNSFQALVSPMYAQMRINAIENNKLKQLRDSLLPKLMNGEIEINGI